MNWLLETVFFLPSLRNVPLVSPPPPPHPHPLPPPLPNAIWNMFKVLSVLPTLYCGVVGRGERIEEMNSGRSYGMREEPLVRMEKQSDPEGKPHEENGRLGWSSKSVVAHYWRDRLESVPLFVAGTDLYVGVSGALVPVLSWSGFLVLPSECFPALHGPDLGRGAQGRVILLRNRRAFYTSWVDWWMDEWMGRRMDGWRTDGRMDDWQCEWMGEWMRSEWVSQSFTVWVSEWVSDWVSEWAS